MCVNETTEYVCGHEFKDHILCYDAYRCYEDEEVHLVEPRACDSCVARSQVGRSRRTEQRVANEAMAKLEQQNRPTDRRMARFRAVDTAMREDIERERQERLQAAMVEEEEEEEEEEGEEDIRNREQQWEEQQERRFAQRGVAETKAVPKKEGRGRRLKRWIARFFRRI
ncbi:hypothetical protein MMC28_002877 [Mycoblastus sanguinarius]|nr:hypothetical protein [Mycoblastus sanguinarius]